MRAVTMTGAIRAAAALAVAAILLGFVHDWRAGLGAVAVAAVLFAGLWWTRDFAARIERHGDRAWTIWLLLPSLGAIGATLLAREHWPIWTVVALAVVTMPTIAVHAMFMGQRDKPPVHGGTGAPPTGALARIVAWLPVVTTVAVLLVLAATGVVDLII